MNKISKYITNTFKKADNTDLSNILRGLPKGIKLRFSLYSSDEFRMVVTFEKKPTLIYVDEIYEIEKNIKSSSEKLLKNLERTNVFEVPPRASKVELNCESHTFFFHNEFYFSLKGVNPDYMSMFDKLHNILKSKGHFVG